MDWKNHLIKHLQWSDSIINREAKEHVAREIAATAKDGDVIGAGSGSTVYLTLFELSRRIREEGRLDAGGQDLGDAGGIPLSGQPESENELIFSIYTTRRRGRENRSPALCVLCSAAGGMF